MAALHRAIAFVQMGHVAVLIAQNLHFDVLGARNVFFQKNGRVAEGDRLRFALHPANGADRKIDAPLSCRARRRQRPP
jgi:hypothetical protein